MLILAEQYKKLPSEVLNIKDEYTAFCFNEACSAIVLKIKQGEEPIFLEDKVETHFTSFKDFYKRIGG